MTEEKPLADDKQEYSQKFYEEYLSKYYPKALVIRERFFSSKDVAEVAGALKEFVDLLSMEPWFYVADKPQGFKLVNYWEFIIDQCSLINAYLKKAYVDLETTKVFVPKLNAYSGYQCDYFSLKTMSSKKNKQLIEYLKCFDNEVIASFYALSFDYVVKLFNEGILLKDIKKANRYNFDLEFILNKLQGTMYEAEYQEHLKIVKELLALLKHNLNIDNDNNNMDAPLFNDNEKSKKYLQESRLLEV